MSHTVSDSEKERLYSKFREPAPDDPILDYKGGAPKRDDPLEVNRDNLVFVVTAGGPLFGLEKGRVMETGLSREDVKASRGITTHNGAIPDAEHDEYVNVRYGTATMSCCYVPVEYVLEIVADECEWSDKERCHVPV